MQNEAGEYPIINIKNRTSIRVPAKAIHIASLLALAAPFVVYGYFTLRYAVNIPFQDDFDVALNFTSNFIHAETAGNRIRLIFALHNEHQIIFCRLAILGDYYFEHAVNFRNCIILGNLGWVLLVAMLTVIFYKDFRLPFFKLIPIPLCLLSLTHSGNMFAAMAALVNYWFILFAVAFLYCLSRFRLIGTLVLFPIAFFSSGGGTVLFVLGNLYLAAKRRWKMALPLFGISTVSAIIYVRNYSIPSNHPRLIEMIIHPFRSATYILAYLGNIWPPQFGSQTIVALSSATGLAVVVLSTYVITRPQSDDFLRLTLSFILLTAVAAASTRITLGIGQALSSRYSIFPLLALMFVYVYAITSGKFSASFYVWSTTAVCTTIYWLATAVVYDKRIADTRERRIIAVEAFKYGDTDGLKEIYLPSADRAAEILLNAQQQGIYNYQHYE